MKYLPMGYTICLRSNTPACFHIPVLTNSHTDKRWPYFPQPLNQKVLIFFLSSQGVVTCLPFLLLSFFLICNLERPYDFERRTHVFSVKKMF